MSAVAADLPPARRSARAHAAGALAATGRLVAWAILGAGLVVALAIVGARVTGARPLTVLTGSMEPVLHPGDVVVDRMVAPTAVTPGDLVTFPDADRHGALVTHRVRLVTRRGNTVDVVTRGDANTGIERWSMPAHGRVGRVLYRIPRLGTLGALVRTRVGLLLVVVLPALLLAAVELRAVWRPEPGDPGA